MGIKLLHLNNQDPARSISSIKAITIIYAAKIELNTKEKQLPHKWLRLWRIIDYGNNPMSILNQPNRSAMHTLLPCNRTASKPLSLRYWQKLVCVVFLLITHKGLRSHTEIHCFEKWKSKFAAGFQNNAETVTIYGTAQYGHVRLDSSAVQINVNNLFVVTTMTDRRGRFSFQLQPEMYLDTLRIRAAGRREVIFTPHESALLASKRMYRLKYRARVFTGCPSF